jgi:hypothetical protein
MAKQESFTQRMLSCIPQGSGKRGTLHLKSTTITSSKQIGPINDELNIPLSVLDQAYAPYVVAALEIFFKSPLDTNLLAHSLSSTLAQYPLFTGRLVSNKNGNIHVVATKQHSGALFIEANSSATLNDILPPSHTTTTVFDPPDLTPFHPPSPTNIMGYLDKPNIPILSVQLTHLADGSCCLSMTCPHIVSDLGTGKILMASWGAMYQQMKVKEKETGDEMGSTGQQDDESIATLFHVPLENKPLYSHRLLEELFHNNNDGDGDRKEQSTSMLFERRNWATVPKLVWKITTGRWKWGGSDTVGCFISTERLAQLKMQAMNEILQLLNQKHPQSQSQSQLPAVWISTNDALVARIAKVIGNLPIRRGQDHLEVAVAVDMRGKSIKGLPKVIGRNTIGNCLWVVKVKSKNGSGGSGMGEVALELRRGILSLDKKRVEKEVDWLRKEMSADNIVMPFVPKGVANNVSATSSPVLVTSWGWSFEEELSFGGDDQVVWHQPQLLPQGPNVVYIVPSPYKDGVFVYTCLHQMAADQLREALLDGSGNY